MYEEAREKVAKKLHEQDIQDGVAEAYYWEHTSVRENYFAKANQILSILLTPSQLKEWKEGGELGVICKDQSLPEGVFDYEQHKRIFDELGFRRVVGKEG